MPENSDKKAGVEIFKCVQIERLLTGGKSRVDVYVNGENFLDNKKDNSEKKKKLKGYMSDINTIRIINKKEKYDFVRKNPVATAKPKKVKPEKPKRPEKISEILARSVIMAISQNSVVLEESILEAGVNLDVEIPVATPEDSMPMAEKLVDSE